MILSILRKSCPYLLGNCVVSCITLVLTAGTVETQLAYALVIATVGAISTGLLMMQVIRIIRDVAVPRMSPPRAWFMLLSSFCLWGSVLTGGVASSMALGSAVGLSLGYVVVSSTVLSVGGMLLHRRRGAGKRHAIPLNVKFLFYLFLDAKTCDALVGDLEERFQLILREFGPGKAKFWYWTMAIRSVGPIAWAWGTRCAFKLVKPVVVWLIGHGVLHPDSWRAVIEDLLKRIRG